MATCKDCIHFEVCDSGRHIGEYIKDDGIYSDGVEKECIAFRASADYAEVKHGTWEESLFPRRCGFRKVKDFICGVCGKEYAIELPCYIVNYCPGCGAKMDGGDTE